MELLVTLGRTLGFSFAAGVNLYATIAILGLASRFDWVALPPQFAVFDSNWVIGAAIVCYAIEFVADKVPWVDTAWDAVHTVIRPIGGAFIAVTTLGEASPGAQAAVALLGGGVAAASHLTKASTRVAANSSPEPFSNWALSLLEDVFVVGVGALALAFPALAFGVVLGLLVLIAVFSMAIVRAFRRRGRRDGGPNGGAQLPTVNASV
jgi:Domain of unknown function (DUF4126)